MDKLIFFGRVYTFYSSKRECDYYKIDYLDENGMACSDFINQDSYTQIKQKNLKLGELCHAHLELNQYNRGEIVNCTSD